MQVIIIIFPHTHVVSTAFIICTKLGQSICSIHHVRGGSVSDNYNFSIKLTVSIDYNFLININVIPLLVLIYPNQFSSSSSTKTLAQYL